jgi:2-haloacid dehalogenase
MTIQAVIFDIGNVLIEWQPERYYDPRIGAERRRAMFAEVDLHGMNDEIDRGGDFRETVYRWAEKYPQWREEIRLWHDDWLEMAKPAIPHSVRLLRALRAKGVPVFALTNFGIGTWAIATPAYDFLNEFGHPYVSGHMGVIKPEARIYEMVEEHSGIAPEGLLFADDRIDNIRAAEARGWQVHHFAGPEGWAARLVAEGLLTAEEAR